MPDVVHRSVHEIARAEEQQLGIRSHRHPFAIRSRSRIGDARPPSILIFQELVDAQIGYSAQRRHSPRTRIAWGAVEHRWMSLRDDEQTLVARHKQGLG